MNPRDAFDARDDDRPIAAGGDAPYDADRDAPDVADRDTRYVDAAFEADLRSALFAVDPPPGLLARLATIPDRAAGDADRVAGEADGDVEATGQVTLAKSDDGERDREDVRSRRRFLAYGAGALAAAASVALAIYFVGPATDFERWNDETLARRAIAWTNYLEQDDRNREAWTAIPPQRTERTLGVWIRRPPDAWGQYRLTGTNDRRFLGDVYRFGGAARSEAMLFVVGAATVPEALPSSPPATPGWTSEGFAVGMWRQGGKLYVLAVRGDANDYARLIRRQGVA